MALKRWQVYGFHWRHSIAVDGVKAVRADLTDDKELQRLFHVIEPQAVIHTAAIAQTGLCEDDPDTTHAINARVPALLADLCADQRIPFLFTSTDLVFNGREAPYDEQSEVTPVSAYGRQKARAEAAVLKGNPEALVCRLPLMFGFGPRLSGNFSIDMLTAIRRNRPIKLFTDEFRTPVDFQSAAQGLLKVLGRAKGLMHLGGRTTVSRYALGLLMAEQMGADSSMLYPVSIDTLSTRVTRSPDCTLNSSWAYTLGYDPLPLSEGVKQVVDQFNVISNSMTRRES
jgi:dTDP-4-dehydrorhamnose reductase